MDTEATPFFEEVAARPEFQGLFGEDEKWTALVADPTEELVPVPPPSFRELLDQLKTAVPDEVIAATWHSVDSERAQRGAETQVIERIEVEQADIYDETMKEIERGEGGDDDNDGPAGDAEGAEPGRGVVVGDAEGGDPQGEGDG